VVGSFHCLARYDFLWFGRTGVAGARLLRAAMLWVAPWGGTSSRLGSGSSLLDDGSPRRGGVSEPGSLARVASGSLVSRALALVSQRRCANDAERDEMLLEGLCPLRSAKDSRCRARRSVTASARPRPWMQKGRALALYRARLWRRMKETSRWRGACLARARVARDRGRGPGAQVGASAGE